MDTHNNLRPFEHYKGQELTPELLRTFRKTYKTVRVLGYWDRSGCKCNPYRLNIRVEEDNTIVSIFAG